MRSRGKIAIEHRIQCGWMKYHPLQSTFEDHHIPIKLRLKLFDAAITATVLYSLETCPLTEGLLQRLDVVQRKMLRRIIGWISASDESWEERGHRMKIRFERCMGKCPVSEWSHVVQERKFKLHDTVDELPFLTSSALKWDPVDCSSANFCHAFRSRGRPFTRW